MSSSNSSMPRRKAAPPPRNRGEGEDRAVSAAPTRRTKVDPQRLGTRGCANTSRSIRITPTQETPRGFTPRTCKPQLPAACPSGIAPHPRAAAMSRAPSARHAECSQVAVALLACRIRALVASESSVTVGRREALNGRQQQCSPPRKKDARTAPALTCARSRLPHVRDQGWVRSLPRSWGDPVRSYAVRAFDAFYGKPELLADRAAEKPADAVRLPSCCAHEFGQRGAAVPLEEPQDGVFLRFLRAHRLLRCCSRCLAPHAESSERTTPRGARVLAGCRLSHRRLPFESRALRPRSLVRSYRHRLQGISGTSFPTLRGRTDWTLLRRSQGVASCTMLGGSYEPFVGVAAADALAAR